jgi:hypothetical protein
VENESVLACYEIEWLDDGALIGSEQPAT